MFQYKTTKLVNVNIICLVNNLDTRTSNEVKIGTGRNLKWYMRYLKTNIFLDHLTFSIKMSFQHFRKTGGCALMATSFYHVKNINI